MPWTEIPDTVSNVLDYVPNPFSFKIKADAGKLYYWTAITNIKHVSKDYPDERDDIFNGYANID